MPEERRNMTKNIKQQKCLIYCRVSDSKQSAEGSGLLSQEHRCRGWADDKGYDIEEIFRDEYTGGGDYARRPGMMALLDHLRKNKRNQYIILFDDLKRLSRDTRYYLELRDLITGYGAKLECLNFRYDDSPEGEFHEELIAATGKLERKQIARQTLQKTKARFEAGYYAFNARLGYKFAHVKGHGNLLVRDEPVASVIQEALEGFASGRFGSKAELKRFLEQSPVFPKSSSGKIGNNVVPLLLTNVVYAGYVEYEPWGISRRKGQHEGLVSWETYCKNQDKLNGRSHAPARTDLNKDFVLRNFVSCECGNALTAAWSKSCTGRHYAYYVCQNRKCEYKGKSLRRDKLEGEFEEVLARSAPPKQLFTVADKMFRKLWEHRASAQAAARKVLEAEMAENDKKIDQLLDRIVDSSSQTVANALEAKVEKLQRTQLVLAEKITKTGQPVRSFDEMYRTAMSYLANPLNLWKFGGFEGKRTVLKLTFSNRIEYDRKTGYRTPDFSLPFKALGDIFMLEKLMVPRGRLELPRP